MYYNIFCFILVAVVKWTNSSVLSYYPKSVSCSVPQFTSSSSSQATLASLNSLMTFLEKKMSEMGERKKRIRTKVGRIESQIRQLLRRKSDTEASVKTYLQRIERTEQMLKGKQTLFRMWAGEMTSLQRKIDMVENGCRALKVRIEQEWGSGEDYESIKTYCATNKLIRFHEYDQIINRNNLVVKQLQSQRDFLQNIMPNLQNDLTTMQRQLMMSRAKYQLMVEQVRIASNRITISYSIQRALRVKSRGAKQVKKKLLSTVNIMRSDLVKKFTSFLANVDDLRVQRSGRYMIEKLNEKISVATKKAAQILCPSPSSQIPSSPSSANSLPRHQQPRYSAMNRYREMLAMWRRRNQVLRLPKKSQATNNYHQTVGQGPPSPPSH